MDLRSGPLRLGPAPPDSPPQPQRAAKGLYGGAYDFAGSAKSKALPNRRVESVLTFTGVRSLSDVFTKKFNRRVEFPQRVVM